MCNYRSLGSKVSCRFRGHKKNVAHYKLLFGVFNPSRLNRSNVEFPGMLHGHAGSKYPLEEDIIEFIVLYFGWDGEVC